MPDSAVLTFTDADAYHASILGAQGGRHRQHFPSLAALAASIKEWGWTSPALVGEDGGLIAGHARVLAARQLGIAEIPVMVAAGWSEAQKRAYVLADNQLAITGSGWDPELLRLELGELKLSSRDHPLDE